MADEDSWFEWASEHFGDIFGKHDHTFLQETGRDESLARMRVQSWRERRPDVQSRLLRRRVVAADWEDVAGDG